MTQMTCRRAVARRLLASAVIVVLATACQTAGPNAGQAEPSPGADYLPAEMLADSVGVNIHVAYSDTAYGDLARLVRLLQDLGVHHVRDGVRVASPAEDAAVVALRNAGISLLLISGDPRHGNGTGSTQQALGWLRGSARGSFDSIEGANEWDCSGSPTWKEELRRYQLMTEPAFRAAFPTAALIAPSFCRAANQRSYGSADGVAATNAHFYAAGKAPETTLGPVLADARLLNAESQVWVTETGYHNSLIGEHEQPGVSERAAATYIVRTLLGDANRGVTRTYLYELLDEKADNRGDQMEQHFGLVRNDGTPKPAFWAVRNLLQLLASRAPSGSQGTSVNVESDDGSMQHLIVSEPDGRRIVFVWRAASVWDLQEQRDLAPRPSSARLTSSRTARWQRLDVSKQGAVPTDMGTQRALEVAVGGAPIAFIATPTGD